MTVGLYSDQLSNDPAKNINTTPYGLQAEFDPGAEGVNVTQYGWSGEAVSGVTLIQDYLVQARDILAEVKLAEANLASVISGAQYVKSAYDYIKAAHEDLLVKYPEVQNYYNQIVTTFNNAVIEASKASASATSASNSVKTAQGLLTQMQTIQTSVQNTYAKVVADVAAITQIKKDVIALNEEAKKLVEDLQKGQVYRGTWNPHTDAWPDFKGTNSVWDVVLNQGEASFVWNNIKWLSGDRLLYILLEKKYQQIESGVGVLSINGKSGTVVISAGDLNVYTKPEVDAKVNLKFDKTGGTLTGNIIGPSFIQTGAQGAGGTSLTRRDFVETLLTGKIDEIPQALNTSTDWNTLETSGFYNVYAGTGVVFTNAPASFTYGTLQVIGSGKAANTFVTQIATARADGTTFIRTRTDGAMTWTPWVKQYNENQKPNAADIKARSDTWVPTWDEVTGKPTSFTPTTHTHTWSQLTGIPVQATRWPTPAEAGAVNKVGDTMTGELIVPTLKITSAGTGIKNNANSNIIRSGGSGQSTIVGNTSEPTYIDALDARVIVRNQTSVEYRAYHEGFKPTATDVGARPATWVPAWSDITGVPTAMNPSAHKHVWADITNPPTAAQLGGLSNTGGTVTGEIIATKFKATDASGFTSSTDTGMGMYTNATEKRTIIGGGADTGFVVIRPKGIGSAASNTTFNTDGTITSSATGTMPTHLITKGYVDTGLANQVTKTGDTMTGNLQITTEGRTLTLRNGTEAKYGAGLVSDTGSTGIFTGSSTEASPYWQKSGVTYKIYNENLKPTPAEIGAATAAHSHSDATTSASGFMSAADKTKLNGLSNYVHPTGDGHLHVPSTGTTSNGMVLTAGATAGSIGWKALSPGDIGAKPAAWYPTWAEVTGKPATMAPSAHRHSWADLDNLPAQATRWPTWDEVTSKPTTMAPSAHKHPWADLTGVPTFATRWPTAAEVKARPDTWIPDALTLRVNTDANLPTTVGYSAYRNDAAAKNFPRGVLGGGYEVVVGQADGKTVDSSIFQLWNPNDSTEVYIRTGDGSATGWVFRTWEKLYTSVSKPSASDVGAVSKAGDTMTGGLILNAGLTVNGSIRKTGAGDLIIADQKGVALREAQLYNIDGILQVRSDLNADSDKLGGVNFESATLTHKGAKIFSTINKPTWSEVDGKPTEFTPPKGSIKNGVGLGKEDLDTLKTTGFYFQHANANTSSEQHYPENAAGCLIVTEGAGPKQTYHVYNSSRIYTRAQYGSGGWTPWVRQYNTDFKPTAADVGARPSTWVPAWTDVTGIPTTFAPSAHQHPWGEITGVPVFATRWPTAAEVGARDTKWIPDSLQLRDNPDANIPTTIGFSAFRNIATAKNFPKAVIGTGWEIVLGQADGKTTDSSIYQSWSPNDSTEVYIRTGDGTASGWAFRAWEKVYTSVSKPTAAEVGAVNKAGDTMTGNLTISNTAPQLIFNESDNSNKKYILVSDGLGFRLNEDTTSGKILVGYKPADNGVTLYNPYTDQAQGTKAGSLTRKDYVDTALGTKVDKTVTVNGKPLSGNITLSTEDVGAAKEYPMNLASDTKGKRSIRLFTINKTDANCAFVVAGLGDFGQSRKAWYNVNVGTRGNAISVDAFSFNEKNAADTAMFYTNIVGDVFEVWMQVSDYNLDNRFHLISSSGTSLKLDSQTTTKDFAGFTLHPTIKVYTSDDKPTSVDVGALSSTGGTVTGNITAPDFIQSTAQSALAASSTRKDYVDGLIATKVDKSVTINGKPLSGNISLAFGDVGAFNAGGITGTVTAAAGVPWTNNSGVYTSSNVGDSDLITHFKGAGSCPALQLKARYKNGGLWYRSARDSLGFEEDWTSIYTSKNKPSADDVGAYAKNLVDDMLATKLNLAGGLVTGDISAPNFLQTTAQSNLAASCTRKDYVDGLLATKLNLTGGTVTGNITAPDFLQSTAQSALANSSTRKDYVDTQDNLRVLKTTTVNGKALSGNITLAATDVKALPDTLDAMKEQVIAAPAGAVAGTYYPILFTNAGDKGLVYISTKSSGGADPMNNCSFRGSVRSGGWSDKGSVVEGVFTIHETNERALHSIHGGTENDGFFVAYVAGNAFPVTVRANHDVVVTTSATSVTSGTSIFTASANPVTGNTKTVVLADFAKGDGLYLNSELCLTTANTNTDSKWASIINKVPTINSAGVMEVGRYLDMHTNNSVADFDVRLDCDGANSLGIYGSGGKLAQFAAGGNLGLTGSLNAGAGVNGVDFRATGSMTINGSAPTFWFQDTDNRSAATHVNSNLFYVLRGTGNNAVAFDSGPNGRHPMTLSLETGDVVFSGNVVAYSDKRLKKDIKPLENALEKVMKLDGVNYKRIGNDTDRVECGFIAQDLQKVIPEVVIEQADEDKTLAVDYAKMNAYLVEAIKEQQKMIEELKSQIEEIKGGTK